MIQASHIHLMRKLRIGGVITPFHYYLHVVQVRTSQFVRRILNIIENVNVKKYNFFLFFSGERKNLSSLIKIASTFF